MSNRFTVRVSDFSTLLELEGARTTEDFVALLDAMEAGDVSGLSDDELREMCIMSLQDLEPAEAAYVVLKHDMGDALRDGQARNAATEMLDEKLWEEYVDPKLHERMFNAGSLLYAAFPRSFPKPDAVRVRLHVTAQDANARALVSASPHESFVVRLLADGMEDHAVVRRLYSSELAGKSFPSADTVVWIARAEPSSPTEMTLEVIGSGYWLDALDDTQSYESNAYPDDVAPAPR